VLSPLCQRESGLPHLRNRPSRLRVMVAHLCLRKLRLLFSRACAVSLLVRPVLYLRWHTVWGQLQQQLNPARVSLTLHKF
jgi:hypothetical protein